MNQHLQNIFYLGIAMIILIIFSVLYPKANYQPHGIFLPLTTKTYPSVEPAKVEQLSLPSNAKPIGIINVLMHFQSASQQALEADAKASISYAVQMAAKNGANAMGPIEIGRTPEQGILDAIQVRAKAYHLN